MAPAPRPVVVARHARTGIVALNVVTAALESDARTAGLDVRFAKNELEMIDQLRSAPEAAPRVALWSFYSLDFARTAAELARVREATRELGVLHVAGGVHATAEPRQTLEAGFDLVAVGEGEATVVEIVGAVSAARDPKALVGTAHLDGGRLVTHGPGPRSALDAFPPFNVRFRKWNAVEITRGCVYACSFCQTPYVFKARFRHRSVENVRRHVQAMARDGVGYVRFLTPTALSYGSDGEQPNLAAVDALLAAVREAIGPRGKIYFGTFPSEIRPEHVTRESLAVLARWVDNRSIIVGAQSGSDRVLRASRRGHDVGAVVRAVEVAVQMGFRPDVDLLLGLPGETREDRDASLRLAEKLVGMGARIHSHAFLPLPGTPLRDAVPETIEPDVAREMGRLEARGQMWGQWRRQVVAAGDLVRQRRAAKAARG
jgi:B12-binding domain/radical SAM domain protein